MSDTGYDVVLMFYLMYDACMDAIHDFKKALNEASRVTVLTGAGISAESGVPTFRGQDGLWKHYRAEELATPEAFQRDPKLVWEWYQWRRGIIGDCRPNEAHKLLAEWEESSSHFALITQNVDGLHRFTGSKEVIELHGNIWEVRCVDEQKTWEDRTVPFKTLPPLCPCGAMLRPNVVWFGESLPQEAIQRAFEEVGSCDLCVVIGTSSIVQPAASLPFHARSSGATVVEVNPEMTPLSGHVQMQFPMTAVEFARHFSADEH